MLASATASLKSQLTGLWNAITSLIGGLNNGGEAATMFSTTAGALAGVVASVAQALSNAAGWAKTFVNTFIETGALQPFLESLTGVISGLGSLVSGLRPRSRRPSASTTARAPPVPRRRASPDC